MIKPIVEGHGEYEAVPILLRRIAQECFEIYDDVILRPERYPSSQLIRKDGNQWRPGPAFMKACGHARNKGATSLLVILDLDDDCAKQVSESVVPSLINATGF